MTNKVWYARSKARILAAVNRAGSLRIRDLKRATHYNRGPEDGIGLWYDALEALAKAGAIRLKLDDYDNPLAAYAVTKPAGVTTGPSAIKSMASTKTQP